MKNKYLMMDINIAYSTLLNMVERYISLFQLCDDENYRYRGIIRNMITENMKYDE